MSQQVNYTSAACGLANSLCSTLLRLIGRTFAFDALLFALQDRTQPKLCDYIKVYQKKKLQALANIEIFKKQQTKPPKTNMHIYILQTHFFCI